ncbi:hypothetical protein EKN56_01960 [Limnobaculum zhutongyuii]|uniref:DUF3944 domain-containing protein n=1 Tax=Limnobaculum zhutongyuii TaxID=2498113 RepID=A0A411WGT2_9GAMM|nr:hypothetical protein [Limnobaculum zhutongyuii]QBH95276.1 hypothetical protein EKN56_01960 [Limnobaculum zhutongyuii]TQS89106.1 hypothetical protein ELQ32_07940 [Limnobaculum zhutongyuii]
MKRIDFARNDKDLYPVLQQASSDEKAFLAEIIAGKHSSNIDKNERDALKLAIELQSMGGDSLMNLFRQRGVGYREIVADVAGKVGVKIDLQGDIIKIEELIAEKVIEGYKEKLSEKERDEFEKVLRECFEDQNLAMDAKNAAARSLIGITPILLAVGGLILQRGAVVAIPVAGQFLGVLTGVASVALAFTGTAYSVTIPSVLIVGSIRSRLIAENFSAQVEL